jgi:two-component system CheB/CheR fusion protein
MTDAIDGVLVTFFDITRLVESEARQRTLVDELNHRVRNILTMVAAITRQTLARSRSPEEFAETFQGRVHSLANAYALLSREQWSDVPLHDVLRNELDQYRHRSGERIVLDGPPLALKPAAALGLGLIVHELATNAAKHGALSDGKGRVSVAWEINGRKSRNLVLTWREHDGPVVRKPKHKGFGTELIEREVNGALGKATFRYAPRGFEARLSIPLDGDKVAPASPADAGP